MSFAYAATRCPLLPRIPNAGLVAIGAPCGEVIVVNPQSVADFKAGKEAALNFLKGQVMKLSKGKANPAMVGDLLAEKLG